MAAVSDGLESLGYLDLVRVFVLFNLFRVFTNMCFGFLPYVTIAGVVHNLQVKFWLICVKLVHILIRSRLNRDLKSKLWVLLREIIELPKY